MKRRLNKKNPLRQILSLAGLFLASLFFLTPAKAQVTFNVYSGGYFNITDYGGYISDDNSHRFHIALEGTNINIPNWSIKVRINGQILPTGGQQNVGGIPFPADKISLRFTRDDGNPPTLAQINAPMAAIPLVSGAEVPLIPSSQTPLFLQSPNNAYIQNTLFFEVQVAGGSYLDQLKNKQAYQIIVYNVPLTYTLYNGNGVPIGTKDVNYNIQLNQTLTGNPGTNPQYSLEILGDARDGTLDFNSLASYLNGTSVTYPNAVKVNATTGFEITTKSQYVQFGSQTGEVLPIDVLQLQLQPGSDAPAGAQYPAIQLSTNPQLVMRSDIGKSTPMFMNIRYSAAGNDERLIQAKQGKYTTVLIYQLTPR